MKILLFPFLLLTFLTSNVNAQIACGCDVDQIQTNTVKSLDTIVGTIVNVSTVSELWSAFNSANNQGGNMTILIEDGIYDVASTSSYPYLTASNLVIRSASGNRDAVVLTGQGMQDVAPLVEIILSLQGDNVIISDLTLRDCGNHAISINSDNHIIHNVRIQNTFEQMIKGTSPTSTNDNTLVQCSLFEYTDGVGPQWYIGGLDIHGGSNWLVRDNIFIDIASPSQSLAEHAVHFWDDSSDNIVERNMISGCDRGVGFGLGSSENTGGIIRNNMIFNDGSQAFHDVGIGLESSPNTQVYNNTIHIQYQNSIEYRFSSTTNATITNNLTNRPITSRNGGTGTLTTNMQNGLADWYVNPEIADLRLTQSISQVVDQGTDLTGLCDEDIDQTLRPQGSAYDIGAFEFSDSSLPDADNDGYAEDVDCNDQDENVNPGMDEIPYNGIDDDCDEITLDDDLDQDGYNLAEDCDDMNENINPGIEEIPYNGIDDDCNTATLDDDLDQDGFVFADDCDDMNEDVNPDATEIVYNGMDDDCDPETLDDDLDQDGYNLAEDCDDMNENINPGIEEIPYNGIDDDCNTATLDDDLDQDGFVFADDCDDMNEDVNPDATEIIYNGMDDDCDPETLDDDLDQDGYNLAEDCDDMNENINPGLDEIPYNGIDDDCDPTTLDDDLDQDGFVLADDCDDTNPDINPDAEEIPNNGIDEDCDGTDLLVGVLDLQGFEVNVYPNPTTDLLFIEHSKEIKLRFKILTNSGAIILEKEDSDFINLDNFAPGVYFLRIEEVTSGISKMQRIVVL